MYKKNFDSHSYTSEITNSLDFNHELTFSEIKRIAFVVVLKLIILSTSKKYK
jgi:hypothetical protein